MLDFLFGESTQDVSGRLSPMFQQYGAEAQFKPYTVTTGIGQTKYIPELGLTQSTLSPEAEVVRNLAGGGAAGMFSALQGFRPEARAGEIFREQSALLQPEFAKQAQNLKNTLFGSGRLGLGVAGEGAGAGAGTGMVQPDVYGQSLAQNRALAELMAGSRTQALDEAASLARTGGGLLSSAMGISELENALLKLGIDAQTARAAAAYGAGNIALAPQKQELSGARGGPFDILEFGLDAYKGFTSTPKAGG